MTRTLILAFLVLAVLVLAVGGWVVKGARRLFPAPGPQPQPRLAI